MKIGSIFNLTPGLQQWARLARAVLCTDRDDRDHLLQAEVRLPTLQTIFNPFDDALPSFYRGSAHLTTVQMFAVGVSNVNFYAFVRENDVD